ncbi:hypothetical protein REPUB_Repub01dG0111000 [Reevesia pubescens]
MIQAEWRPKNFMEKIVAIIVDGIENVYIRSGIMRKLTVGDMRKVSSPLRSLTESDVETWWDANAIIVSNE